LWQLVLLNQFHDIIPGSSIHRVYEEAEASYAEAVRGAQALAASAQAKLVAKRAQAITVFNALSWERNALVELPSGWSGAETTEGAALRVQSEGSKRWALVPRVPSCGWQSVRRSSTRPERGVAAPLRADRHGLENEHLAITVDASGALTAIVDKASGQDFAAGPCNRLRMYKDVPGWFDAWDIDSMYAQQPVELPAAATVEVIADGPLWVALRVRRTINESTISQDIVLRAGSRRVEFVTTVDWREKHKLLKVDFPVDVRSEDALHEIQFGHVRRPTHATRPYDATRFEVCNHKWTALAEEARGAAVLNDSKYGVNVADRTISLTLLRSPLSPDMTADRGIQQFTYAFQCWTGPFERSGVVQAGYELNAPVSMAAGEADRASLFALDAGNVIIETVKPAEDGSGDVIVRMYEALRTQTHCALRVDLPFAAVSETDMLEAPVAKLKARDGRVALTFRPFEIKTLRLTRR
ncbi:MAG: alpha-mannosidase, partial [Planctomycetes bacterium]|nr:alpha-mannosidase [Planctomycetota bacterium]